MTALLEVAPCNVKPGLEAQFEATIAKVKPIMLRQKGCRSFELRKVVETPGRYWCVLQWETLEDHTVDYNQSEDCKLVVSLVRHLLEKPGLGEHGELVPL